MSKLKRHIEVVFTVDADYALPLAASIRSVIDSAACEDRLRVWAIWAATPTDDIQKVRDSLKLGRHRLEVKTWEDHRLRELPLRRPDLWSYANYVRLFLPELLPACAKVIYLDADTITTTSLGPLWDLDLSGHPVAAMVDPHTRTLDGPNGVQALPSEAIPSAGYFNAGVMVINLDMWRSTGLTERALKYIEQHGDVLVSMDQEALNAVILGAFLPLEPSWNVMTYWEREERRSGIRTNVFDAPRIRHFEGTRKPWTRQELRNSRPLFYEFLDRTAWAGWRPPVEVKNDD